MPKQDNPTRPFRPEGRRRRFRAILARIESPPAPGGGLAITITLRAVAFADTGEPVADLLSFSLGPLWKAALEASGLLFQPAIIGAIVTFEANAAQAPASYAPGHPIEEKPGDHLVWRLSKPSRIKLSARPRGGRSETECGRTGPAVERDVLRASVRSKGRTGRPDRGGARAEPTWGHDG